MPQKNGSTEDTIPPTMSPQQAIPLLRRQIERLDGILKVPFHDPAVDAWESTTVEILNCVYGRPQGKLHPNTYAVLHAQSSQPSFYDKTDIEVDYSQTGERELAEFASAAAEQRYFELKQEKRKALLESYIDQLQDLAPPSAATALDQYRFHPEIERISGQLHRDGHYKHAALEAYIRVIDEVKHRSGIADDGDSLMNHAFACDKKTPMIQFNSLQTDPERDEQKGFMFLFKGIVGLRNSKAHSNTLFNDPYRAHDYLALASLLMRVLEIATTNRP
jgi:uncharacterized protein (TIGR02391 family)